MPVIAIDSVYIPIDQGHNIRRSGAAYRYLCELKCPLTTNQTWTYSAFVLQKPDSMKISFIFSFAFLNLTPRFFFLCVCEIEDNVRIRVLTALTAKFVVFRHVTAESAV